MSQDTPPNDNPTDETDALLREMYERMKTLETRVETLEAEKTQLTEENAELQTDVTSLKKKVTTLETDNRDFRELTDSLESTVESLQGQMNAASARADVLYEEIEQAQADITDQAFHAEGRLADITKRVAGIENELGLEEWETAASPNSCALERFASMPDERRQEELKAPVSRATLVWEHFDEWSSPTHKGRVIRSGELRKLLKAITGKKLAWTQVYRVMEEFEENTNVQYRYLGSDGDDEAFGKALIRLRDFGEGTAVATDGGYDSY